MAIFNYKKREISAKIVYYGPALCGKTTNVQYIHQKLNPRQRGELVSLATDADRTLFFDFLPIELEDVGGFKTRFQIYTVPGQVYYNSTRKAVLTGVDGVIFVADSQNSKRQENIESFNNLIENLKYYNRDVSQIPLILQYNKQDLDGIMTIEELNQLLNQRQLPSFAASAVTGKGVLQSLTACCKQVLQDLKRKSARTEQATNRPRPRTSPTVTPITSPTVTPITSPTAAPITSPTVVQSTSPAVAPTVDEVTQPVKLTNAAIGATITKEKTPPVIPVTLEPVQPEDAHPEAKPLDIVGNNAGDTTTGNRPPFAFSQTDEPATETHKKSETFKPEIAQVGKARLINPYTITLPLRLSTDANQHNLLSVDITFTINDFLQTDPSDDV